MTPLALRTKLTLSYTAILVVLLAALGLAYYRVLSGQLDADATAEVLEVTSGLHGYLQFERGVPALDYDRSDPEEVSFVERVARYFQVYNAATGQLLMQSPALAPLGLQYTPEEVRAFRDHPGIEDVLTDNGRIRFSNGVITPGPGEAYLLQVGVRLAAVDNALQRFVNLLLWSGPVCVLVAIVASRWMAGRALAPLARLAAASREIDIADLGRRLPVRGAGDELDHLAVAFNETLSRLAHAVGDMKQFSTALAHELRTPLAAMRGEAELALLERRSPEEYRRTLSSQLEELDRLARLITQLLTLARAEAGEIPVAHERVDLALLATGVVQSLAPVAQARDITMSCEAAGDVRVIGDAEWLERLLLNLLDNAIKFTGAGGQILVRVSNDSSHARLEVRDTGIGIGADALPHVFERFYQADPARSPATGGVGLGLSLARWIALRHGATIEAASTPGVGTTLTVRFTPGGVTRVPVVLGAAAEVK
jgi:heavy metal sensor kinase